MAALVLLLAIAAFLILPRLLGAAIGASLVAILESAFGARTSSRRTRASFVTALDPSASLWGVCESARMLGAQSTPDASRSLALVDFGGSGRATVTATVDPKGTTRLKFHPDRGTDDIVLSRLRSTVLAHLRQHDPSARQL